MPKSTLLLSIGIVLTLIASSGCANVKPWERDLLARREMGWAPDALEAKREAHIYFSKEASMPAGSGGGGGCGCN